MEEILNGLRILVSGNKNNYEYLSGNYQMMEKSN